MNEIPLFYDLLPIDIISLHFVCWINKPNGPQMSRVQFANPCYRLFFLNSPYQSIYVLSVCSIDHSDTSLVLQNNLCLVPK